MAHTTQSFTKRQRVLLDRLVTFGQWLSEKRLPVSVLEAYGFGSFFRGKGRPHDVDILLRRATDDSDDFRLFSKLLEEVSYGRAYRKFKTPQAALLHAFDKHYAGLIPGLIDVSVQRALFGEWIEGYTWKMLSTSNIAQEITLRSDREIARRFVKRNLPNLNISWWIGPDDSPQQCGLRATFMILFWSKEKPNVRANVEAALLDGDRHSPILEELVRFDQDVFCLDTQIDLVKKAVERLLLTPRSRKPADSSPAWLRAWANRQESLNGKALEIAVFCNDVGLEEKMLNDLGLTYPQPCYDGLSVEQVSERVEERRSQVKQLRQYLEIAQEIIWTLACYKSDGRLPGRTVKEFLTTHLLRNKSQDWWKKGLPVLADLRLPVSQQRVSKFWDRLRSNCAATAIDANEDGDADAADDPQ